MFNAETMKGFSSIPPGLKTDISHAGRDFQRIACLERDRPAEPDHQPAVSGFECRGHAPAVNTDRDAFDLLTSRQGKARKGLAALCHAQPGLDTRAQNALGYAPP